MVRTGYGLTMTEAVITAWSGLRGVVGLVLALEGLDSGVIGTQKGSFRELCFFHFGAVLVLTTVVQGGTFKVVLKACQIDG